MTPTAPEQPFRKIIRLSVGDLLARILSFLAFVYLARVLGVETYGVLEFAVALIAYFLFLADGGLELWATREVARGGDPAHLVALTVALRLALAVIAGAVLWLLSTGLPPFPRLRLLLLLFSLTLLVQAVDLRWLLMGREEMRSVARGLVIAQIAFAAIVFLLVRRPEDVAWVAVARAAGNAAMAVYFGRRARGLSPAIGARLTLRGSWTALGPALTLGASRLLALLGFNFDTLLLGILVGAQAAGFYNAAYKPIAAVLIAASSYFLGLFPILSRLFGESEESFRGLMRRSLRLMGLFAVPIAVGGTFLAGPLIALLYGDSFAPAAPVLRILAWSAALVLLRGTFRQSLCAAGEQRLDLACAAGGAGLNVGLNLLLIPRYGLMGAAFATLASEVVWLIVIVAVSRRRLGSLDLLPILGRPLAAGLLMALTLWTLSPLAWQIPAAVAGTVYLVVLFLLGERWEI